MEIEISQRTLLNKDAEELFNLIDKNRKHLSPWLPWVNKTTCVNDTLLFIHKTKALLRAKRGIFFAIFCNNKICGIVGASCPENNSKFFEINYWISEEFCNKNITTYGVRQLISFLKKKFGAEKIFINTRKDNLASIKVAKKVGGKFSRSLLKDNLEFEEYVLQ